MRSILTPAIIGASILVLSACNGGDGTAATATSTVAATTTETTNATTAETIAPTTTQPPSTQPPSTQPATAEPASTDEGAEAMVDAAIANLAKAYRTTDGVWVGFVPNEHPSVIVFKNQSGEHVATVAVDHPAPDELGAATALPTDGLPFRSLHRIVDPVDTGYYDGLAAFDFHAQLGGVDSFAMIAGGPDAFFDPEQPDWASTWIHEMFHRYQDTAFAPGTTGQDVEGYDYSADNIRLAALEERALAAALHTDDVDERREAARHFAGLRLARLAADTRVALDQSQERIEGTARFLEHRFAGDDTSYVYHSANYDRDLAVGFDTGIKDHYGFGRFYGTGSAVLRLAMLEGVDADEIATRVEAGEAPADILAAAVGVTASDAAGLVVAAESAYDPSGDLVDEAEAAATRVADEPPVFGDDDGSDAAPDDANGEGDDGEGFVLTDDDIACLAEQGVDLDTDTVISDEAFAACLADGT